VIVPEAVSLRETEHMHLDAQRVLEFVTPYRLVEIAASRGRVAEINYRP
jgi:hypothetical protein